jgi:hypothetical protein
VTKALEIIFGTIHPYAAEAFIARVTRDGSRCNLLGVVLNDGMPLKSAEVRIRWPVTAGDVGSSHEQQVFLEAVQLFLEWHYARRARTRVARDRRDLEGSANRKGPGKQEICGLFQHVLKQGEGGNPEVQGRAPSNERLIATPLRRIGPSTTRIASGRPSTPLGTTSQGRPPSAPQCASSPLRRRRWTRVSAPGR